MKALNIVVRGDSLALPKVARWEHSDLPGLCVRNSETFPEVLADQIERLTGRRPTVVNTSFRGMHWDLYEAGLGIGLEDMIETLEADLFISTFGGTMIWAYAIEGLSTDHAVDLGKVHVERLNALSAAFPALSILLVTIPDPPARLVERYPTLIPMRDAYREAVAERAAGPIHVVPTVSGEGLLHTDGQHYSVAGHRVVADLLLERATQVGAVVAAGGPRG